jgi:hypothetical protein
MCCQPSSFDPAVTALKLRSRLAAFDMCLKPIREVASKEEKNKIMIRLRIDWNPMAQIKPLIEHENLGATGGPIYRGPI